VKTALITGISGQDGAYLSRLLLKENYRVIGGMRRSASNSLWRLEKLGILNDIEFTEIELGEYSNIVRTIDKFKPDEIYNLAAQSFVQSSFEIPLYTSDVNALGALRILEAIREVNTKIKYYQASTSEMFGKITEPIQNEKTSFHPRSPYGVSKLYAHWIAVNYREAYNMFTCSGILFNHESPLRGEEFVTRKITIGLSKIKLGLSKFLELGNLNAKRDWGHASDYVKAMYLMIQAQTPDNFVIASGKTHKIIDFIELAAKAIGIKIYWEGEGLKKRGIRGDTGKTIIKVNPKYFRPSEVDLLVGDSSKAKKLLKWKPKITFKELVYDMAESDYKILYDGLGKS